MRRRSRDRDFNSIGADSARRLSNSDSRLRRVMLRLLLLFVIGFTGYAVFDSNNGFIHIYKLKKVQTELIKSNHHLLVKLMNAELTKRRLNDDLGYLEYIARSKYNMSLPGEVIYKIKE